MAKLNKIRDAMKENSTIQVDGKSIGIGNPCFIVAEAGVNHNGQMDLARQLIDQAKAVGADAVKFQIFVPDEIATKDAAKGAYQKETTGESESQYEMLTKLALTEEQFEELQDYSKEVGIIFYATPHDLASVDIFDRLNLPVIKIASPDLNNGLLLYKISQNETLKTKPLFLSTGGGTFEDVGRSLEFLKSHGFDGPLLVYHCTSSYPTPSEEQNLLVLGEYKKRFGQKFNALVGFSDNGDNVEVPADAVVLGAVSVEKHMTLDKNMPGPDHRASLNAEEFKEMVRLIREAESTGRTAVKNTDALGDGVKRVQPSEADNIEIFRKAVRARADMAVGDLVSFERLIPKRTRGKYNPMDFEVLLGRKLKVSVSADQEITPEMVE